MSGAPAAHETLLGRVIRETLSFGALQAAAQVFALLSNIVLARVLLPSDFGIYDICGFFIGLGTLLGDAGLGASLIRKAEEPTAEEYGSILVANVTVGAALTLIFVGLAPVLAHVYRLNGSAAWVLMAMAPGYLIGSFKSYPMIRIERELRFGKIARIELFVLILRQCSAVTLALLHFGVWALVAANLTGALVAVALTFVVQPGLPPFKFSAAAFRPLLVFGAKVQALTVIAFFKDNVSNAMLGALAGPSSVGFFNFAVRYIQTPAGGGQLAGPGAAAHVRTPAARSGCFVCRRARRASHLVSARCSVLVAAHDRRTLAGEDDLGTSSGARDRGRLWAAAEHGGRPGREPAVHLAASAQ